jgi:hypothetical protein
LFSWYANGIIQGSNVPITGAAQPLQFPGPVNSGISVNFSLTTGYAVNDFWDFCLFAGSWEFDIRDGTGHGDTIADNRGTIRPVGVTLNVNPAPLTPTITGTFRPDVFRNWLQYFASDPIFVPSPFNPTGLDDMSLVDVNGEHLAYGAWAIDVLHWQLDYRLQIDAGSFAFSGSGLNDFSLLGTYTGIAVRNYAVEIDGQISRMFAVYDAAAAGAPSGLDDMSTGGTYGIAGAFWTYEIEITVAGATDEFRWRRGNLAWSANTAITPGVAQTLDYGVTITFAAQTGHNTDDRWALIPTDTFRWSNDAGANWVGTGVNITIESVGAAFTQPPVLADFQVPAAGILLNYGVSVDFTNYIYHTGDERWDWSTYNTFRWHDRNSGSGGFAHLAAASVDNPVDASAIFVPIEDTNPILLQAGVYVQFAATAGHDVLSYWDFRVTFPLFEVFNAENSGQDGIYRIYHLMSDGVTATAARQLGTGIKTLNMLHTTELVPEDDDNTNDTTAELYIASEDVQDVQRWVQGKVRISREITHDRLYVGGPGSTIVPP